MISADPDFGSSHTLAGSPAVGRAGDGLSSYGMKGFTGTVTFIGSTRNGMPGFGAA